VSVGPRGRGSAPGGGTGVSARGHRTVRDVRGGAEGARADRRKGAREAQEGRVPGRRNCWAKRNAATCGKAGASPKKAVPRKCGGPSGKRRRIRLRPNCRWDSLNLTLEVVESALREPLRNVGSGFM